MSKTHTKIRATIALLIITSTLAVARRSHTEDRAALKTTIFSDNCGLLVQAPTLMLVKKLSRVAAIAIQYSLDRVNIPPVREVSGVPLPTDGISGASRPVSSDNSSVDGAFLKKRNEFLGSLSFGSFDITSYYSAEADYIGRLFSIGINQDFLQKNTNIALRVGYGWDAITPTGRLSSYEKTNVLANLTLTQILSRKSIMRLGMDISYIDGFQANPYRTVFINGGYFYETHPVQRTRVAGFFKLNTYLQSLDAALWLDYRIYGDDWGVISHTIGAKLYQNVTDRLMIRYRYRFYSQSAAYFYSENYPLVNGPGFFSGDYKLMPFHANLFGFQLDYQAPQLERWLPFANEPALHVKYERYFTSEYFGANILQFGLNFGF